MGLLTTLLRGGSPLAVNPMDDRYWTRTGSTYTTTTGITMTPDLAFSASCIFQGTRLIAEPMGRFKPILYRRLGANGEAGKERARQHPLWPRLMKSVNAWMTASRFRVVMTARAVLWGNAYAEIRPTEDAAIGELRPLDPERVEVEQILETGRLVYRVIQADGTKRPLPQERVFHLPGFGVHKFMGAELLYFARQAVALWLAQEKFNALYFRQGTASTLAFEIKGLLGEEAHTRLRDSIATNVSGLDNMHRVLIGEEGGSFKELGNTAKDSQMVEAREAQVHEIARWMNIPVHLLRATQQPTFASIEMFNSEYYDITLAPWFDCWEQEIGRQLLTGDTDEDEFFAEFLLDALLRANTLDRAQSYGMLIDHGVYSQNEVRAQGYNLNIRPGEEMDTPRRSANIGGGGDARTTTRPRSAQVPPGREPDEEEDVAEARLPTPVRDIVAAAAQRVVHREVETIRAKAPRFAADPEGWVTWLDEFYAEQAKYLADTLQLWPRAVSSYVEEHRAALLADGLSVVEGWDREAAAGLVRLVLEQTAPPA
ncbi:MAG: phage portal protein [Candidatus Rokubacteria bacterium]|nr:phage portal protein [Candidatus Rokubacteria bacterium]